jgi:hypothetical protein
LANCLISYIDQSGHGTLIAGQEISGDSFFNLHAMKLQFGCIINKACKYNELEKAVWGNHFWA